MLVCKVGSEQTQVGTLADGKFAKLTIMDLLKDVPEDVKALYTRISKTWWKSCRRKMKRRAKQILHKLAQVAADVESWYEQQGGDDAAATVAK